MKRLILETFEREIHRKVTINILIDELFFRYDKDNDHSISGYELKSLVTDYIMYNNIKELLQICHSTQWLNTADRDVDGFLSKYEFSWSFGMVGLCLFVFFFSAKICRIFFKIMVLKEFEIMD